MSTYGRRQRAALPFMCGVALMVYPLIASVTVWLVVIGLLLVGIPYFVRI